MYIFKPHASLMFSSRAASSSTVDTRPPQDWIISFCRLEYVLVCSRVSESHHHPPGLTRDVRTIVYLLTERSLSLSRTSRLNQRTTIFPFCAPPQLPRAVPKYRRGPIAVYEIGETFKKISYTVRGKGETVIRRLELLDRRTCEVVTSREVGEVMSKLVSTVRRWDSPLLSSESTVTFRPQFTPGKCHINAKYGRERTAHRIIFGGTCPPTPMLPLSPANATSELTTVPVYAPLWITSYYWPYRDL